MDSPRRPEHLTNCRQVGSRCVANPAVRRAARRYAGERRESQLRGRQGRLAFAYLVLHRDRPVRRDALIEALWAHEGAPPSDTALAPVLSRLRRAIEPAVLEGRDTLRLTFREPVWVDVEAIAELAARRRPDAAREAAALAEPGLLPDLDAPWLREPARSDIEELRVDALEQVARARRGRTPSAPRPRAAVAAAPFRESARAALISALAQRGNLAEASWPTTSSACSCARSSARCPAGARRAPRAAARARAPPRPRARRRPARARRRAGRDRRRAGAADRGRRRRARLRRPGRDRQDAAARRPARARAGRGRGDPRRPRRRARARVRLRRRAPALRGAREPRRRRRRARVRRGRPGRRPVRRAQRALPYAAALAARRPLVLCIDDLQWSDTASLRFVAYLTRRVAGAAGARRDDDPHRRARRRRAAAGRDRPGPGDGRRPPRPLTADGTPGSSPTLLGDADGAFAAACQDVTAGNPLLLRQLLTALAAERVRRTPARRVRARDRPARGVEHRAAAARPAARARGRRRTRGRRARRAARAARHRRARRDRRDRGRGGDRGARAGRDPARRRAAGFVHPLVRDAVYLELPPPGAGSSTPAPRACWPGSAPARSGSPRS